MDKRRSRCVREPGGYVLAIGYSIHRYISHVLKNVGGIYEVQKSVEQSGDVYSPTPKAIQKKPLLFTQATV
jgi:hypothetical protein